MKSQIQAEFVKETDKSRFNQGDILKGVKIGDISIDNQSNDAVFSLIELQYAIVVTQDCDLEQDYKNVSNGNSVKDKIIPNILLLPAYLEEDFKTGNHREGIKMFEWNSKLYDPIPKNMHLRFHFIKSNERFQIPNLIIDFKHLYSVNRDYLYHKSSEVYVATICELFRENLSHRYSHYLSRVGLPEL